jgi:hypothetical protein
MMHLRMNSYRDSDCYQNTALSCVSCLDTFFIKTKTGCLKSFRDGCMLQHVYRYRLTMCFKCSEVLRNFSVPVSCTMVTGTNQITN